MKAFIISSRDALLLAEHDSAHDHFDATIVPSGERKSPLGLTRIRTAAGAIDECPHDEIGGNCAWHSEKERSYQRRPDQSDKNVAMKIIPDRDVTDPDLPGSGSMQDTVSDLVFPPENRRHQGQDDVVQRDCNSRSDFIALEQPGYPN